jgi:hypothetical protein
VRPTATAAAKPAAPKQEALILPKANVAPDQQSTGANKKKSFLQDIFGGGTDASQPDKKKKKKKKTLFDSIF